MGVNVAGYRLLHPQYQPDQGSAAVPEVQTEPVIHGLCQQDAKNTQVHTYMYSLVNFNTGILISSLLLFLKSQLVTLSLFSQNRQVITLSFRV